MYYLRYSLLFFLLMYSSGCHSTKEGMVDVGKVDRARILKAADAYVEEEPVTVTAAHSPRSAGGLHDFYSEGDYWWPDPDNPDGPYIRRDGQTNPDNFTAHRKAMRNLSVWVPALVAAYEITGEEKYAVHAVQHLMAWFVDEKTRMNPNLRYAQAIMGRVTGRGIGIIDTIHLVEVAKAIERLAAMGYLQGDKLQGIKSWFNQYVDWLFHSDFGKSERDNGNNHSTCWAMQVGEFAKLVGDTAKMQYCREFYKNTLLPGQMAKDGSFPRELERTKPYGYMLFNMDAMAMVCEILSTPDDDLWHYKTPDGRYMKLAIEFMYPYIKDKSTWFKQPDIMYFDEWPVRHPALLFAGLAYEEPKYIALWKTLDPDPTVEEIIRNYPIRQPVLWVDEE